MRFHLVGLPHSQATSAFSACAYTDKLRKFTKMMTALGHEVLLYGGEEAEAPPTELIPCAGLAAASVATAAAATVILRAIPDRCVLR